MKNKEKYNLSELTASKGRLFGKPVLHVYQGRDLKTRKEIATIRRSDEWIGERKKVDLLLDWLEMEYKESPILDEKEKEYLSAVIRPWRDKVKDIFKTAYNEYDYIVIEYYDNGYLQVIRMPLFEKGTMYKDMELCREYTLEELEL